MATLYGENGKKQLGLDTPITNGNIVPAGELDTAVLACHDGSSCQKAHGVRRRNTLRRIRQDRSFQPRRRNGHLLAREKDGGVKDLSRVVGERRNDPQRGRPVHRRNR